MCGIVGYVGGRPCRDLLIAGLEKLEYRGYDSAGVSVLADGQIDSVRAVGNLANLRAAVDEHDAERRRRRSPSPRRRRRSASPTPAGRPTAGSPRRTPTRTATAPTRSTSSSTGSSRTTPSCARELEAEGHDFSSETDAEIVAHLIERHYDGDLTDGGPRRLRRAARPLRLRRHARRPARHAGRRPARSARWSSASARARTSSPRRSPPSSPRPATRMLIENGEIVTIDARRRRRSPTPTGNPVERDAEEVTWDEDAAEKGGYETFMLKEIHEQPDAVAETIADRLPSARRRRPLRGRARRRLPARASSGS